MNEKIVLLQTWSGETSVEKKMISLSNAKEGIYKIVNIEKCGKGRLKKLYNLGVLVGDIIEVIKPGPGPVIIKKGNTRIGIGSGIANDIIVEPIAEK